MNAEATDNQCACSIRTWSNAAFHWIHSRVDEFFCKIPFVFEKYIDRFSKSNPNKVFFFRNVFNNQNKLLIQCKMNKTNLSQRYVPSVCLSNQCDIQYTCSAMATSSVSVTFTFDTRLSFYLTHVDKYTQNSSCNLLMSFIVVC